MILQAAGNDLGFGSAKFALYHEGDITGVAVPAILSPYDGRELGSLGGGMRRAVKPPVLEVDEGAFLVGAGAGDWGRVMESGDLDRLHGIEARAVSLAALATAVKAVGSAYAVDGDVTVEINKMTVGLPVMAERPLRTLRDRLARQWREPQIFTWEGQKFKVMVQKIGFVAQGTAALLDYYLDTQGAFNNQGTRSEEWAGRGAQDLVGVLSMGQRTIELVLARGVEFLPKGTASDLLGVRTLLERVQTRMPGWTIPELDLQLQRGGLNLDGDLQIWQREVAGVINRRWGDYLPRIGRIIIVGGGAHLVSPGELGLPSERVVIPADPVLSIAHGLCKVANQEG